MTLTSNLYLFNFIFNQKGETMGTLHLVSLPRNDTHKISEYIKDKCDLSDGKGSPLDITVTGIGSESFKKNIENQLKIKSVQLTRLNLKKNQLDV